MAAINQKRRQPVPVIHTSKLRIEAGASRLGNLEWPARTSPRIARNLE